MKYDMSILTTIIKFRDIFLINIPSIIFIFNCSAFEHLCSLVILFHLILSPVKSFSKGL